MSNTTDATDLEAAGVTYYGDFASDSVLWSASLKASTQTSAGQSTRVALSVLGVGSYESLQFGIEDAYEAVIRTYGNDII